MQTKVRQPALQELLPEASRCSGIGAGNNNKKEINFLTLKESQKSKGKKK